MRPLKKIKCVSFLTPLSPRINSLAPLPLPQMDGATLLSRPKISVANAAKVLEQSGTIGFKREPHTKALKLLMENP